MRKDYKSSRIIVSIVIFFCTLFICARMSIAQTKYYKLQNGIEIIVKEDNRNKVVSVQTWIKGGSSLENKNNYGISHLIEHMLFKGTKNKTGSEINNIIKSKGGYFNAATSYDYTKYYIVMPSYYVKTALEIESDILKNSLFNKNELESEKNVVLEERKRNIDNPEGYLWVQFMGDNPNAYPYKNPIIGYQNTLKNIDTKDIVKFINEKYVGHNIYIVITGDVDADKIYKEIKNLYGDIIEGNRNIYDTSSYKQNIGFRYSKYKNKQSKAYVLMGYKVPELKHEDMYALDILSEIIGGGLSSRLYQSLISNEVVTDYINASIFSGRYPGYLLISARLDPYKTKDCINKIYNEIDNICQNGVTPKEMESAISRLETSYMEIKEDYAEDADVIGYYHLIKNYKYAEEYINNLKKVTRDEIISVAKKYLLLKNNKLFISYPKHLDNNIMPDEKQIKTMFNKAYVGRIDSLSTTKNNETLKNDIVKKSIYKNKKAKLLTLSNGIKVVFVKDTSLPVVSINTAWVGGLANEDINNNGITAFLQNMILKGNLNMKRKEIEICLDNLGARMSMIYDKNKIGMSCYVLIRNFEKAMKIYFESMFNPVFPKNEIEKIRLQIINEIKAKDDDIEYFAEEKAKSMLFPESNPYGFSLEGTAANIKKINKNGLIKWHDSFYKPKGMVISVCGDIEENTLISILNQYIRNIKNENNYLNNNASKLTINSKSVTESYINREREQTTVVYNCIGPSINSKDFYPFRLFNVVMNGLGGKIFQKLREEEGLVYDAYSYLDQSLGAGIFKIIASCDPRNEEKVRNKIKQLFNDVKLNGITQDEYAKAKQYYKGILMISMQSNQAKSIAYINNELYGRGYRNTELLPALIDKISKKEIEDSVKKYINFNKGAWFIVRAKN